jgi:hypothetical protein
MNEKIARGLLLIAITRIKLNIDRSKFGHNIFEFKELNNMSHVSKIVYENTTLVLNYRAKNTFHCVFLSRKKTDS